MAEEEISDEEHQANRDILAQLVTEAPTDISHVLQCYCYDEDGDHIYDEFNKCLKTDLQDAANYLQQLQKSYRYKDKV